MSYIVRRVHTPYTHRTSINCILLRNDDGFHCRRGGRCGAHRHEIIAVIEHIGADEVL